MRNKGAIIGIGIILSLISIYQLTFTYITKSVDKEAREFAQDDTKLYSDYLDSISDETVYSFLGLKDYTYRECKELEINLGLDLKGGMNVTLEVSVEEILRALSNYSKDSVFNKVISIAKQNKKNSQDDFMTLFLNVFQTNYPDVQLASIFSTRDLSTKISFNTTNEEVEIVLRTEVEAAIENTFNILRTRIDRFGVSQPNIQKAEITGRILIELPGVKDPRRVSKLLQGMAHLEFWETYDNTEIYTQYLEKANEQLIKILTKDEEPDTLTKKNSADIKQGTTTSEDEILKILENDTATLQDEIIDPAVNNEKQYPLFTKLYPNVDNEGRLLDGSTIGLSKAKDTSLVNYYLSLKQIKSIFPRNLKFVWGSKPLDKNRDIYKLHAIKISSRDGKAPLTGNYITEASQEYGETGVEPEIQMIMNTEGAKIWSRLTKNNINKSIAIVLDGYVISAPTVQGEIPNGISQITGNFTIEEAQDLANILKSGKLPAPTRIVRNEIVGPTLGAESIKAGTFSFIIAFIIVLIYMIFFYSKDAGITANIALLVNMFFIIGILASFGAVLTLPGIAGIILTIGMSVDANVLIYERINEELNAGKGLKLALVDGYKNAYSAIFDANITTFLTGVILYYFGTGPIKGFATTLIIGICTSLFCAIFVTRIIFEYKLNKGAHRILFVSNLTKNLLSHTKFKFFEKRKLSYTISTICIFIALVSLFTKGLNQSIDFLGGRSYTVRFEQDVSTEKIREELTTVFNSTPEVKTYGTNNQFKITTKYKIDEEDKEIDEEVEQLLYQGLASILGTEITRKEFDNNYKMSSQKVGPTIADDIKKSAVFSILFALIIIFLYILLRFKSWQYGLGAIIALAHDAIIVLGIFSLFSYSLEINQAFIAAILTVAGYSINDTVVVFDRIREYFTLYPQKEKQIIVNSALNNTLRRTFSTSLSTFIVLLTIYLFGGKVIQEFTLALLIGVIVGTYSSIFIATPIALDTQKRVQKVIGRMRK